MKEIQRIHPKLRPGSVDFWHKSSQHWCRRVESQVYWDGGEHIYQMQGNSQTISHGFSSILHHLNDDCTDAVMQLLNSIFTFCEEVTHHVLILQSVAEEYRVCIQPCLACLFVQVIHCFINFFSLCTLPLRSYH